MVTSAQFGDGVAYVAGQYVPIEQASIPITDWGFLRSDARQGNGEEQERKRHEYAHHPPSFRHLETNFVDRN